MTLFDYSVRLAVDGYEIISGKAPWDDYDVPFEYEAVLHVAAESEERAAELARYYDTEVPHTPYFPWPNVHAEKQEVIGVKCEGVSTEEEEGVYDIEFD